MNISKLKNRAKGYWPTIFKMITPNLEEALSRLGEHVPCPLPGHEDSVDGFRFFDDVAATGGGVCNTCGTFSDGFSLLQKLMNWTFPQTLAKVTKYLDELGVPAEGSGYSEQDEQYQSTEPDPDVQDRIDNILDYSVENHPRVKEYLMDRGLSGETYDLLCHEDLLCVEPDGKKYRFDTMVAEVVKNDEVVGVHRTYLSKKGAGKAKIPDPKKFTKALYPGDYKGGAIWIDGEAETVGVAEGIETALAPYEATGMPMRAMPSNLLKHIEFGDEVKTIYIWADNDASRVGENAADELAAKQMALGRDVYFCMPSKVDTDWLDVLNDPDLGAEAIVKAKDEALKYDPKDYPLESKDDADDTGVMVDSNEEQSGKLPLQRKKTPGIPFPVDDLSDQLQKIIKAIAELTQAPIALCAQCIISAITLVLQGFADIEIDGRVKPISNFYWTIGESGERKSAVEDICNKAIGNMKRIFVLSLKKKCINTSRPWLFMKKSIKILQKKMVIIVKWKKPWRSLVLHLKNR